MVHQLPQRGLDAVEAASQRLSLSGLTIESEFVLTGTAMTAALQVSIEREGNDIFVVADGVKIAKLAHLGTVETWVSLEPGWTVRNCDDGDSIVVECKRQRMH